MIIVNLNLVLLRSKDKGVYKVSKFGVKGFTDVLRIDLKESKIHAGAVYQSGTNTKMFEKTGENFPIDVFTEPDDLAEAVVFMLSRPDRMFIPEIHIEKE